MIDMMANVMFITGVVGIIVGSYGFLTLFMELFSEEQPERAQKGERYDE